MAGDPSPIFDVWLNGYDTGYEDALAGRRRPQTRTERGLTNVFDLDQFASRRDGATEKEAR